MIKDRFPKGNGFFIYYIPTTIFALLFPYLYRRGLPRLSPQITTYDLMHYSDKRRGRPRLYRFAGDFTLIIALFL
jgi:hypothetical protein